MSEIQQKELDALVQQLLKEQKLLAEQKQCIHNERIIGQPSDWWWQQRCREYNRIQKCGHLKGSRVYGLMRRDYNVSFHTFINGEQRIRCLNNCGFEVWNRPGWSYKWQYAMKMVKQSTNTRTASEVVPAGTKNFGFSIRSPYTFTEGFLDIDDANPIKGMQKATKYRDDEEGILLL